MTCFDHLTSSSLTGFIGFLPAHKWTGLIAICYQTSQSLALQDGILCQDPEAFKRQKQENPKINMEVTPMPSRIIVFWGPQTYATLTSCPFSTSSSVTWMKLQKSQAWRPQTIGPLQRLAKYWKLKWLKLQNPSICQPPAIPPASPISPCPKVCLWYHYQSHRQRQHQHP